MPSYYQCPKCGKNATTIMEKKQIPWHGGRMMDYMLKLKCDCGNEFTVGGEK